VLKEEASQEGESMTLLDEILDEMWIIPHFDVHSHFGLREGEVKGLEGFLANWSQPETPPQGMSQEGLAEWRRSRWPMKRSTWFSRSFQVALRRLYGRDDTRGLLAEMNRIRSMTIEEAVDWMCERSGVERIVVDSNPKLAVRCERVLSTYRLDARSLTLEPEGLWEIVGRVEGEVKEMRLKGSVSCFKVPVAYLRTLRFEGVEEEEAERISDLPPRKRKAEEQRMLEDFVYRYFFRKAGEWDMPVEIHTGFGWAIHRRPLRLWEADPENLLPVLEDESFRSTRFVLFHGGYPFTSKAAYLAASFSNVYLDFTCLSPESWSLLKRCLHEWIDVVPMDRIVTGSDGSYEWVFFASMFNRQCLAEVLAEKIETEFMDRALATQVGRRILRENAAELFLG